MSKGSFSAVVRGGLAAFAAATALSAASAFAGGWGHGSDCANCAQPDNSQLFRQYYGVTGNGGSYGHTMYPSPMPVPGYVGHTYYTYPPFSPHLMMHKHISFPGRRTIVRYH